MWRVISSRRDFLFVLFVLPFLYLFPARYGPLSYHDRTSVALPPDPISPQPMCHGVVSRPGRSSVAAGSPQRDFGCGQGRKKDPLFVLSRKKTGTPDFLRGALSEMLFPGPDRSCVSSPGPYFASYILHKYTRLWADFVDKISPQTGSKIGPFLVQFWFNINTSLRFNEDPLSGSF